MKLKDLPKPTVRENQQDVRELILDVAVESLSKKDVIYLLQMALSRLPTAAVHTIYDKLNRPHPVREALDPADARRVWRDVRQQVRDGINQLNAVLAMHFDRGQRYDNPGADTIQRLSRAAEKLKEAHDILAQGTPDDRPD